MDSEHTGYRTSDLYYAAYLKVAGVSHEDTIRVKGRVFFIFGQPEGGQEVLKDLKRQYFNRKAKVAALTFADEVKNMKNLTHMAEEEEGG
jgi:hypothetical protein